jgi:hypothetical protein
MTCKRHKFEHTRVPAQWGFNFDIFKNEKLRKKKIKYEKTKTI